MYIKNLKKIVLLLCLLTIAPCLIHSQDTSKITITSEQLRTTNLIFAEHKEYSKLVPLLQQENTNLLIVNDTWARSDSLKTLQLHEKEQEMLKQAQHIEKLKKELKVSSTVGGTVIGIGILAAILFGCLK